MVAWFFLAFFGGLGAIFALLRGCGLQVGFDLVYGRGTWPLSFPYISVSAAPVPQESLAPRPALKVNPQRHSPPKLPGLEPPWPPRLREFTLVEQYEPPERGYPVEHYRPAVTGGALILVAPAVALLPAGP